MAGLNINRRKIDSVIGVVKAYTTRVGAGPFPTEFSDEAFADNFRQKSREFGVSTGRPRRCGWLDLGKPSSLNQFPTKSVSFTDGMVFQFS